MLPLRADPAWMANPRVGRGNQLPDPGRGGSFGRAGLEAAVGLGADTGGVDSGGVRAGRLTPGAIGEVGAIDEPLPGMAPIGTGG